MLPVGEQIDEPRRHERHRRRHSLVDRGNGNHNLAAPCSGSPQDNLGNRLADEDPRDALPLVGQDGDPSVLRPDHRRGIKNRLCEMGYEPLAGDAHRHRGQVWTKHRRTLTYRVALRAGKLPGMEDVRAAGRIALTGYLSGEGSLILGQQLLGERAGRLGCHTAASQNGQPHDPHEARSPGD